MRIKVPLCAIFTKEISLRHLWSILCKPPTVFFNTNTDKNVKMKCVPHKVEMMLRMRGTNVCFGVVIKEIKEFENSF